MLTIVSALSEEALSSARTLFREYGSLPEVTPCVSDFDREIAGLPGAYAPPDGRLLLAMEPKGDGLGEAIGCGALRRWNEDTCEMKRVFVRPEFRGAGAGRALVSELIAQGRAIGYRRMVLDTLPWMEQAHKLYRALGFREISAYQEKPLPGALFFELRLD